MNSVGATVVGTFREVYLDRWKGSAGSAGKPERMVVGRKSQNKLPNATKCCKETAKCGDAPCRPSTQEGKAWRYESEASLSYIVRQTELYSKTLSQKLRGGGGS